MAKKIRARDLAPGDVNDSNGDVLKQIYAIGGDTGLVWTTADGDERRHHDAPTAVYTIR